MCARSLRLFARGCLRSVAFALCCALVRRKHGDRVFAAVVFLKGDVCVPADLGAGQARGEAIDFLAVAARLHDREGGQPRPQLDCFGVLHVGDVDLHTVISTLANIHSCIHKHAHTHRNNNKHARFRLSGPAARGLQGECAASTVCCGDRHLSSNATLRWSPVRRAARSTHM